MILIAALSVLQIPPFNQLTTLLFPVDYSNASQVSVDLGRWNDRKGITQVEVPGDGVTSSVTIAGKDARVTVSSDDPYTRYIYFKADPTFTQDEADRYALRIEYLDVGFSDFVIQYNSIMNAYEETYPRKRNNSGEWRTVNITLIEAHLRGRQDGGADFRIATDDTNFYVNQVILKKP